MEPKDFFKGTGPSVDLAFRRWESMPSMQSLCPFKLGNGFELSELSCSCAHCKKDALPNNARGELISDDKGGFQIKSIAWCHRCNLLTFYRGAIEPKDDTCVIYRDPTPPYWSPWGEDNTSVRGGFGATS